MNLASLVKPGYLQGRVVDAFWRWRSTPPQPPGPLTWPIDEDVLREVVITWPGIYGWGPFRQWGEPLRLALGRFATIQVGEVPQPYKGVISFTLIHRQRIYRINIEVSDYLDLNEEAYDHADLHFKMQWGLDGYGERPRLVPGGYLTNHPNIYAFLPRLRALRETATPLYDVHGRFGLSFDFRRKALDILKASHAFRFFGGQSKVPYGSFLREVARSKICIDLPSYSPITFRLIDYLAVGCCVIGPPHLSRLHVPLQDGVHLAYCKPDYSDLEELCLHYLRHDSEREALVRNSRQFFDAYLHRDQLAAYYLHQCARLLN
jgi:hypothetical protein